MKSPKCPFCGIRLRGIIPFKGQKILDEVAHCAHCGRLIGWDSPASPYISKYARAREEASDDDKDAGAGE